jgi:hypothetical protein
MWNFHDFIIEMAKLSNFIMWENFAREVASNICANMSINFLEGNLETKHGA